MYLALLCLPLAGGLIAGLLHLICVYCNNKGARYINLISWLITVVPMVISFILSVIILQNLISYNEVKKVPLFSWFVVDNIYVFWELNFNILSTIMVLIISLVSFFVFFYSLGYMGIQVKEKLSKFMFYLSCFSFFMIFLVLSNDLLQLFLAWEGISLFSYYLISFLYDNKNAPKAANKSFIVNRVADFSFLLGLFLTFQTFGTLNIDNIFNQLQAFQEHIISFFSFNINVNLAISFLFTIAAMGKSAQLFFQVWLPDAMEAPTPVSALLHAATMVTAGVFLLVKLSPLINTSSEALIFIILVGSITAFLGASIALVSTNLKKIIAYSTISQLGYMFMAIGCKFYNGAIFHVFTHAFFKGCLFLCAGVIIHRLKGEQDIYRMGGLYKKMPIIYIATWISILALSGVPPFSGFYSKEAIIEQTLAEGSYINIFAYALASVTVLLTAFYCFKILILVFHGTPKYNYYSSHKSFTMTMSVVVLAVLSIIVGSYYKSFIGENSKQFWNNAIVYVTSNGSHNVFLSYLPIALTVVGIFSAYLIYFKRYGMANNIVNTFSRTHKFLVNKWYFDKIYEKLFVNNFYRIGKVLSFNDEKVLNIMGVNFLTRVTYRMSVLCNKVQTGKFYHYVGVALLGVFVLLLLLLWGV